MLIDKVVNINKKLNELDFNRLWPNFTMKPFALYDDNFVYANQNIYGLKQEPCTTEETVFVSKKDEQFNGNTAIKIENQYLAIWNADSITNTPLNKLSAMIAHEMFHGHQYEGNEKRFPDELKGINYPVETENFYLRYIERDLLLKAAEAKDTKSMLTNATQFFIVRSKRKEIIKEFIDYEKAIETVEGLAVYVEFKAFNSIENISVKPSQYIIDYKKIDMNYLSIRKNTYNQGLLLGLIADKLMPKWKTDFLSETTYLSDYIECYLKENSVNTVDFKNLMSSNSVIKSEINDCVKEWHKKIDVAFKTFDQEKKAVQLNGKIKVTGFDPMNVIRKDQWLIHQNFLRIDTGQGDEVLKGPVKTKIGKSVFDILELEY